ncbi:MAG TPA: nuclear transport factor 2 family protein, partial [Steroidobacteraceae bacterium]|nr:nuclear transport factor 2 family protein [Steroidobacteraceae bacterium]
SGEANGEIGDDRVRVVLNTTRSPVAAAPAPDPLYEKMLALDTALFDSFNKCSDPEQFEKHAAFFAKDVEFYHDLGGLTVGADEVMATTRKNVCGKFRRELDAASFRVFPIPGYGAMSTGTHRFCHTSTTCEGVGEFTTVWREKDGVWQITRALSYAHRSLESAASAK